jgi:hypothetical protein
VNCGISQGIAQAGSYTVDLFVTAPDGTTVSTPNPGPTTLGVTNLASVVVIDPMLGTYTVGVEEINTGLSVVATSGQTLVCSVFETRGSKTVLLNALTGSTAPLLPGQTTQFSTPFVYSPPI